MERGVLGDHLAERVAELLAVGLVARDDRHRDDRVGEDHRLQGGRVLGIGERVAGPHVLHADDGDDVARLRHLDQVPVVGVHLDHAADPLLLAGEGVEHRVTLLEGARVDADERQRAEAVVHDLEGERAEGLARVDLGDLAGLVALEVDLGLRVDLGRVGEVVHDRVQHLLHALVLEGRAAERREERQIARALADAALQGGDVGLVALEVGLEDVVVLLDGALDELRAVLLDVLLHVLGDVLDLVVLGQAGVVPDVRLALEQIDDADELGLGADRQHHDQRLGAEDGLDLVDDAVEVRAETVELVDVDDPRDVRVVRVAPVGLGLGLDAARAAEHTDAAVEHLQRPVDLDGEVDVAGGVDDVELVVLPEAGRGGRLDRDPALLLLVHEVGRRGAVVHLTELVDLARELEDALGRRRLAGVDVRENTDVSVLAEVLHGLPWALPRWRRVRGRLLA